MNTSFIDDPTINQTKEEAEEDTLVCKICAKKFLDDKSFNKHLYPAHKITAVEFYQKYWPRFDLFDNSIIKFKNKTQYMSQQFNGKKTLKQWLSRQSEQTCKDFCRKLLLDRKSKGYSVTPTQVELRSILSPSLIYFDELFANEGGYYKLCGDLGFAPRFSPIDEKMFIDVECRDLNKFKIIVDSREQKPLKFNLATEVKGLKFGDYALDHPGYSNCSIERKSISDLIGTLSTGYERFQREIDRAKEAGAYLVILVENDLNTCLSFDYLPHIKRHTKLTPDFIFHNVRELCQKYSHVQFLFADGRTEAARLIEKIFLLPGLHQNFDLQLAYDKKLL